VALDDALGWIIQNIGWGFVIEGGRLEAFGDRSVLEGPEGTSKAWFSKHRKEKESAHADGGGSLIFMAAIGIAAPDPGTDAGHAAHAEECPECSAQLHIVGPMSAGRDGEAAGVGESVP